MRTRLFFVPEILAAVLLVCAAVMSSGCERLSALARADAIEKEAQVNRLRFLEKVRDAYFLIGDEYYRLAIEAEDKGDEKMAKEYSAKAGLYLMFSKGVKNELEELRAEMEAPNLPELDDGGVLETAP